MEVCCQVCGHPHTMSDAPRRVRSVHFRCTACAALHILTPTGAERVSLTKPSLRSEPELPRFSLPPPTLPSEATSTSARAPCEPWPAESDDNAKDDEPTTLRIPPAASGKKGRAGVVIALGLAVGVGAAIFVPLDGAREPTARAELHAEDPLTLVATPPRSRDAAPRTPTLGPPPTAAPRGFARPPQRPAPPTSAPTTGPDPAQGPLAVAPEPPDDVEPAPAADAPPSSPPEVTPVADLPAIDENALKASMATAASRAAMCSEPDGPRGSGRVAVTVAPSGRTTLALVEGPPFAGTTVGTCVARAFQGVTIPPFLGGYTKVYRTFTVR